MDMNERQDGSFAAVALWVNSATAIPSVYTSTGVCPSDQALPNSPDNIKMVCSSPFEVKVYHSKYWAASRNLKC